MKEDFILGFVYYQNESRKKEYLIPIDELMQNYPDKTAVFGGQMARGEVPKIFLKKDIESKTGLEVFVEGILGEFDFKERNIKIIRCRTLSQETKEDYRWVGGEEFYECLKKELVIVPREVSIFFERYG